MKRSEIVHRRSQTLTAQKCVIIRLSSSGAWLQTTVKDPLAGRAQPTMDVVLPGAREQTVIDSLQIRTLGGLAIKQDGERVDDFASRKAELLLVYLACNPRAHQREALADLLWDDRPQRRAMANLRVVLSSLRKAAGPFVTITRGTAAIKSDANVWLDAAELEEALSGEMTAETVEAASEALDLYRGDFLQGVHVGEARDLEAWMVRERERLHRLAVSGGQRLVEHFLEAGNFREGLPLARRLLEIDPLLEAVYRQLMELLARDGQRAAALAQFETCRRVLEDELGVEPAGETVALYEAIRDDALPERPLSAVQPAMAVPDVTAFPPFLMEAEAEDGDGDIFVAREPELAWLDDHLEEALAGNGRLIFISGEAGMGKTALLQQFVRRAGDEHPELLAAVGRCSALSDAADPYLPFRQLLGQLTGDVEGALAAGHLTAAQAARLWQGSAGAVVALLQHGTSLVNHFLSSPALLDRAERATGGGEWLAPLHALARQEAPPLAETGDLQQQVTAVLQAVAKRQPLLLLLDDAQWADSASLALLFHLCHHLSGQRILIAAAYRPEELEAGGDTHPLNKVVNEARRRFGDVELELAAAVRRQGRAFVDRLLESEPNRLGEAFRQELHKRTGGHPLFTVELLRAMQGRGDLVLDDDGFWVEGESLAWAQLPGQIEGVIAERVNRLPPDLRYLLEVASVEGETFTAQVLARVVNAGERHVLRLLSGELDRRYRLAHAAGRQEQDGRRLNRYRFRHALFRQYLYAQLDDAERAYLHEDVGLALETIYEDNAASIVAQLAYHFRLADVPDKAITYSLQAGDAARTLYAHDEAVDHYHHALALLKAGGEYGRAARTLMKLGLTHHQAFHYRQAQRAYEEAFRQWQHVPAGQNQSLLPAPHPLRVAIEEPLRLDPTLPVAKESMNVIMQLFARLVEQTETLEIVPDVARRWEIQDGGRRYVFHLRRNVRWSDGAPLTAHDFEFAWKRVLDPATEAINADLLYDIRGARAYHCGEHADTDRLGIRAPNDHTLVVDLEQPAAYFLSVAADLATMAMPRHVVTAAGDQWADPANIVTSGPFCLESWQPGNRMELVRNHHYHRAQRGNVERVSLYFHRTEREQEQLYVSDKLDLIHLNWVHSFGRADLARFVQRNMDDLLSITSLVTLTINYNFRHPPFTDVRVRRAFAHSVDRDSFVRISGWNSRLPATGGFVPPGMPGHTPDIGLPFDPVRARQLLAEAGFPDGKGFPAVTLAWPKSWATDRHCRWFAEQWRAHLGVSVDWHLESFPEYVSYVRENQPALFILGWIADYPDPDNFLRVAWSVFQPSWQDEHYRQLVEEARRVTEQSRRLALYREADRMLIENAYIVPLAHTRYGFLLKPWVKQYPVLPNGTFFWKDVIIDPH